MSKNKPGFSLCVQSQNCEHGERHSPFFSLPISLASRHVFPAS